MTPRDRIAHGLVPLAIVLGHLATARGYGIFRDELYYLACARQLDCHGHIKHLGARGVHTVAPRSITAWA